MFFRNCVRAVLLRMLPTPNPESRFWKRLGYDMYFRYFDWYRTLEKKVVLFHKQELRSLDAEYRMHEALTELVRRRQTAMAQGIGPLDRAYPDIFEVLEASK